MRYRTGRRRRIFWLLSAYVGYYILQNFGDLTFFIEAVMSLPETSGISQQKKISWPWEWDGKAPRLPKIDEDTTGTVANPVYRLQVRGTTDYDLAYEIYQPDGTTDHLSASVRRNIGLIRLSGDDRNDRDLRLIQGSALDRLLSDKTLRARLGNRLGSSDVENELKDNAKINLKTLDEAFKKQDLPTGLGLGLTGGQGLSLNALIGLTATLSDVKLPLANWGAGTRRLAALEIAATHQGENPITLVDEVERGLEPYRQRILVDGLYARGSQVFITTHSTAVLSAASNATIWYLDSARVIGRLPASAASHLKHDPETFLARLAIIAEGATEVGFLRYLLHRAIGNDPLNNGIWITDGGGNEKTLELLSGLVGSGLKFGGFVDNEGCNLNKWEAIRKKVGSLLFQWPTGCLEENIIKLVPPENLENFIKDTDGVSGVRLRTLADRLGMVEKEFPSIIKNAKDLTKLIIEAATGTIPEDKQDADRGDKKELKKHAERWFKSIEGGRELAEKVFTFNLWPKLENQLMPFINAIRLAVSLPPINKIR